MVIIEDTRNKTEKHDTKHEAFAKHGDTLVRCALPCGDYALAPKVSVDTKANMEEIAQNIGGTSKEHARFRRELIKAHEMGTKLYILVENTDGIKTVEDVAHWENPRLEYSPQAVTGARLSKIMKTMQAKYGCTFLFCTPEQAAGAIYLILSREGVQPNGN